MRPENSASPMKFKMPAFAQTAMSRLPEKYRAGVFSLGWSGLGQVMGLVVKLGSTLILTRMLAPEAYGILGTAMAVLTTLEWLSDLGIHPALIRHPKGDQKEFLLTGWVMGLGRGTLLSVAAALAAWPLADFYDEPTLLGVLLVLAARPFLFAIRSPAFPMLRRNLDYRSIFFDEITQAVVGTACSIAMAFVFQSVWAIVLGTMAGAVTSVLLSYVLAPMRPGFAWNREAVKGIYDLGHQVFVNTLIMAAWLNLDRLLGLKLLSPADMGLYAIAFNLSAVMEGLVTRMCDVYFSMLAREESEEAQHAWHRKIMSQVAHWGMPLGALAVLAAPFAIWILYDPRYDGAGIIFSILVGRLMVRTVGQLQFQYLLALAQVRLATYAYLVAVVVQIALFFPMVGRFGVAGMATTVLLSTVALTLTQSILLQRRVGSGMGAFGATVGWAVAGICCAFVVYGLPLTSMKMNADEQIVVTDSGAALETPAGSPVGNGTAEAAMEQVSNDSQSDASATGGGR